MIPRQPHRAKAKKSKKRFWGNVFRSHTLWIAVAAFVVVGSAAYGLLFSSVFAVTHIDIRGNQAVKTAKIQAVVDHSYESKFLFLASPSLLTAKTAAVDSAILQSFPMINHVSVQRVFPHTLLVSVGERQGFAEWCQNSSCFVVDTDGVAFKNAGSGTYPIHIIDTTAQNVSLGQHVISAGEMKFFVAIEHTLEQVSSAVKTSLSATSFTVVAPDRVNVQTSQGWQIYLDPTTKPDWQATKLQTVLSKKIPPDHWQDLSYLDLRYGDQVYVSPQGLIQ